jgi:type II secretory pathway pseudopilin PulG
MASRTRTGNSVAVARREAGFTYVGLIIGMAVLGLIAASTLKLGSLLQRRAAEQELLRVGATYSKALKSYAAASEQGQPRAPKALSELLRDSRFPSPLRHLRQIYADPITGRTDWGMVYDVDKISIIGVYSLSNDQPIKLANFPSGLEKFERKSHLSDWKFTVQP